MKTAPVYGIGTSKRMDPSAANKDKALFTEPGAYNPKMEFYKTQAPNFGFGTDKRKMYEDKKMG